MSRNRLCALLVLACSALSRRESAAADPKPDPRLARAGAIASAQVVFEPFVFAGDRFPEARVADRPALEEAIGPFTIWTRFLDPDNGNVVPVPGKPGPYGAVVWIIVNGGKKYVRYGTVYKLARPLQADVVPTATSASVAAAITVAPEARKPFEDSFRTVVRDRPARELVLDQRFARWLAGVKFSSIADQRKVDGAAAGLAGVTSRMPIPAGDGLTGERQLWVEWRDKLENRTNTKYPILRPSLLRGLATTGAPAGFIGFGGMMGGAKPTNAGPGAMPATASAPVVRSGTLEEAGMKPDALEKIDAVCRSWAADTDEAFAVCIVRNGVVVLHKAYGTRDVKPMTVDTMSWMASVTKTMSAALMMMFVDMGLLQLDDEVAMSIPQFGKVETEQPLTVRSLYDHTSGLHVLPALPDELPDLDLRIVDVLADVEPGKEWAYNGMGYALGGKIMEEQSGEAMPLLYRRWLLEPLGMTHTEVSGTHADAFSTPLDMAKFGQMLLNGGAYGSVRFMRPEVFEQMLPRPLTKSLGPKATKVFGIGLDGTPERFGHGAASGATFSVDRAEQLVVIMCRNKIGKNFDRYNGPFWDAVRGGIQR